MQPPHRCRQFYCKLIIGDIANVHHLFDTTEEWVVALLLFNNKGGYFIRQNTLIFTIARPSRVASIRTIGHRSPHGLAHYFDSALGGWRRCWFVLRKKIYLFAMGAYNNIIMEQETHVPAEFFTTKFPMK